MQEFLNLKNHTHVKNLGHTSEFHFGIYWWFSYFTPVYQKSCWYDLLLLRQHDRLKLVILGHFSHLYPLKNQKNQNFEKMKSGTGDIIILHMCTENQDHMMYASWDMESDRIFYHFGLIFAFYSTNNPEN